MAPPVPSKILIFGATGLIGQYITASILNATPAFDEVSIFTAPNPSPSKQSLLSSWQDKGLKVITGDILSDQDIKAAYEGVDTVISCLGRNVLAHQIKLLTLAEDSGSVQWFFPSEYGTDIEYSAQSAHEKPHQLKLAVRKHIKENIRRVKCTYLVTGPYVDLWFRAAPGLEVAGGFDVAGKKAYVIDDGEGRIGFVTMKE